MTKIKCPYESCRKEFDKPIIVTNFSFMPKKETYYACPYCLTKIGNTTNVCNCLSVTAEPLAAAENETFTENPMKQPEASHPKVLDGTMAPLNVTLDKLESLEKEKADLLAELDELRKGATKKILCLEEEVAALREESEILKKLTKEYFLH